MRLKYVAREFDERLGTEVTTLERLSVSQYRGVIPSSENSARIQAPSSYEKYKVVQPGDLVLNRFNAYKGALGISSYDGVVSPDYMTVKLDTSRVDIRYIEYFLKSVETSAAIKMSMSGMGSSDPDSSAFSRLDKDDLFNLLLPITDLETQRRIADYLDKEISEMDALIEEFEGLISSLESRRGVYLQSKFDPAITGDASMKMGTFAQISLGKTFQGEPKEGQNNAFPVNYVRAANIQPHGQLVLDKQTMYATQDEVDKYTLNAGDVVIVEGGAGFGRSLTLQEDLPGWIFQNHVIRMVPRSGWLGEFLDYTIRAHLYSGYIELQTVGATIPGLSSVRAANLPVAFIPPEAQHKRVTEAREELSHMDTLVEESTHLIENLTARKTALITAVVTGRKEV